MSSHAWVRFARRAVYPVGRRIAFGLTKVVFELLFLVFVVVELLFKSVAFFFEFIDCRDFRVSCCCQNVDLLVHISVSVRSFSMSSFWNFLAPIWRKFSVRSRTMGQSCEIRASSKPGDFRDQVADVSTDPVSHAAHKLGIGQKAGRCLEGVRDFTFVNQVVGNGQIGRAAACRIQSVRHGHVITLNGATGFEHVSGLQYVNPLLQRFQIFFVRRVAEEVSDSGWLSWERNTNPRQLRSMILMAATRGCSIFALKHCFLSSNIVAVSLSSAEQ